MKCTTAWFHIIKAFKEKRRRLSTPTIYWQLRLLSGMRPMLLLRGENKSSAFSTFLEKHFRANKGDAMLTVLSQRMHSSQSSKLLQYLSDSASLDVVLLSLCPHIICKQGGFVSTICFVHCYGKSCHTSFTTTEYPIVSLLYIFISSE